MTMGGSWHSDSNADINNKITAIMYEPSLVNRAIFRFAMAFAKHLRKMGFFIVKTGLNFVLICY